jgi:hypothetical protein
MKFNWGRKSEAERQNEAEHQREDEAVGWCNLIRIGRLDEYLKWLEKRPKDEIINRFLGIIDTKSSHLPICFAEEKPLVVIDGVSFDSIENTQARRTTKIALLLLVKSESGKLSIWNKIQPQWTEQYVSEVKDTIQIMESLAKRCEDTGQENKAVDIRKKIADLKETNKEYAIEW